MANGDVPVCIEPDCAEPDCAMASIPCNGSPPLFHISHGMFHNVRFHDRRRFFKIPGIRAMCCTDGHHRKNKNRAGKNPPGNVMLSHADTASAALNLGADDLSLSAFGPRVTATAPERTSSITP